MLQNFQPELLALLTAALILLGTLLAHFYIKVVLPRAKESAFLQKYGAVWEMLSDVVTQAVLRMAFSQEDLSQFEDEADRTGRDVRLVAAMYIVDRFTEEHGIQLDEEVIVSAIEARLAELKGMEIIPRAGSGEEPDAFANVVPVSQRLIPLGYDDEADTEQVAAFYP